MKKLNIGCGKHPRMEEGWENIDHVALPSVQHVMDLFKFPWDLPSDSYDEFQCHHIVEHIPHEPKWQMHGADIKQSADLWHKYKDLDGFFCFFSEIWRLGVDGAKVHVITPYGFTNGAHQDPTHTRYIVPQTFAYLTAETKESPDFDYQVPCLYVVESVTFDRPEGTETMPPSTLQFSIEHMNNMTRNMYTELRIVK